MKKIILMLLIVFVILFSCSERMTEPDDLPYTTIRYHNSEVVGGWVVYYVWYWGGTPPDAFISRNPPGTFPSSGTDITSGEDFDWDGKLFHCRTIDSTYIEIAAY